MKRLRLVNLLDDFNLGGVARSLAVFDSAEVAEVAVCQVQAVNPDRVAMCRLDADIIALHFPPSWRRLAFVTMLRLANPGAKIIWVEHSYTPAWEALKVPAAGRFHAMLRMARGLVDRVVCVSAAQAAWLGAVTGTCSETGARSLTGTQGVRVIHPYIANAGLRQLPLPKSAGRRLRIGAYGRFDEQKGFDRLIAAHAAGWLPGCDLLIGGFGPDEAALRGLAALDVRFVGKVTDVAEFLAEVDVVAVPSCWEAFGMVANEAREAGRALLVAPVDGLVEQVCDAQAGNAGLVVDFTCEAEVRAAVAALTPDAVWAMGRAGRRATLGCGAERAAQWARLLWELGDEQAGWLDAAAAGEGLPARERGWMYQAA